MNSPQRQNRQNKQANPLALMDSETLSATDIKHEWLVEGIMVANQPAVIGGPQKSLKTSIAIDLGISIGTGKMFLDRFTVPTRRRVALYSGESGIASIKDTAKRVCRAKKVGFHKCCNNFWQSRLPKFGCEKSISNLTEAIHDYEIQVVIIDPLYLCLTGGARAISPSNIYEVGPALASLAEAVLTAGATPILVHHTTKPGGQNSDQPLSLSDLAYAGIGEFARQWLLLNRRADFYSATGASKLVLNVGGSAGHAGTWNLDVLEGQQGADFTGRKWDVQIAERGENGRSRPARRKTATVPEARKLRPRVAK